MNTPRATFQTKKKHNITTHNSCPLLKLYSRCREAAGDNYSVKFIQKFGEKNLTSVEKGDKWWDAFSSAVEGQCNAKLIKTIFPGKWTVNSLLEQFNQIVFSPLTSNQTNLLRPIKLNFYRKFIPR